jgi:hypothetical protein
MTNVTVFKSILDTSTPHVISVGKVLEYIKDGRYKDIINGVRSGSGTKKELPCVCFSGEFTSAVDTEAGVSYRTDQSLTKHSGYVAIDLDDVEDYETKFKELSDNKYVYALWKSPSGTGLHGLIKITDGSRHRDHYRAIINEIEGLDTTCRNESRVMFLSYDPDMYINESSSIFTSVIEETPEATKTEIAYGDGYTDYRKIDIACRMVRLAPDGSKHNTLLRAAILLGGFVSVNRMDEGTARDCLFREILNRDIDDEALAMKTIEDGLAFGRMKPIAETEIELRKIEEEVGDTEAALSFLSNNDADNEFISKFRRGLIPMGLGFGYDDMDNHLLLKTGEFYASLAHAHIGKTTINLWLIFLSAIKHDWNWMIYTGENQSHSIKMKMMEFVVGKKMKDMNDTEYKRSLEWVSDMFYFVDTNQLYSYKDLLNYAETLKKHKAIKGLFIDPYNALKMDLSLGNKYTYDYESYSEMLTFTKRTNISLFLSVHTNTAAQRNRDKDGNQYMPHASDTEGGAALYNRVDNFMTLNRKIKDPNEWMITEMSVDKIRNKETGGKPTSNSNPVKLKMSGGIEFTDEWGQLPFLRSSVLRKIGVI